MPLSEEFEPTLIELSSTFDIESGILSAANGFYFIFSSSLIAFFQKAGKVDENDAEMVYGQSSYKSPMQLSEDLITLSLLPNSRWKNLLNLDIIKVSPNVYITNWFYIQDS